MSVKDRQRILKETIANMGYDKSEDGLFQWKYANGVVAFESKQVWFLIGKDELDGKPFHTLHRHGNCEQAVENWRKMLDKKYRGEGLGDIADDLIAVNVSHLSAEQINKCIDNNLYLTEIVEALERDIRE